MKKEDHFVSMEDIVDENEVEDSLKNEISRIDSILRVASIGIGTILDRKILEANDEICRIVGYERSELVGKDVRMFYLSDNDFEKAGCEVYSNLKGESISNIEQKLKRKDGQIIDVIMSFTQVDPNDLSKGYTFSIQDITEKLLAERTVEEKKERHIRSIFQATPTGIGVTWDRKLIDVNEKMCQIVGRSKEELVGASTRILYSTSDEYERVGKELDVLIGKKEPGVVESQWVDKNGNIRDVYMTFALIDVDNPSTGLTFTVQDVTERKLAEEEIYKLSQFQQTIIESADVWINVFNKNGELVVWNNAAESISGYSKEEMLGNARIYEMLCPDETEFKEVAGAKKAIFSEGKRVSDLETLITRKDGDKRIISWSSRELFDEEQNVVGSIIIGNDITKQKEAEKINKQQVHFMQELIDAIPAPIFYKDSENIYLGCNNAFAEFTGIPKEDLIGKGVYELYEKDVANKYRKMNMDLLKKGGSQTYEYYLQSSSGQKRAVIFNNSIFTDIDGNTAGQIGVVFDITERKVAEEALKKHSHFMHELLETIPAPVYYKDKEGGYLGCNRSFENFSGLKCEDLIGKVASDVYDETQAEEYTRMDQKLVETGGMQSYESEVVYAGDHTRHNVLFNKSVFTDPSGDIAGIIGVILDITAHLRSEEEKRKKERHIRSIFQATPTGIGVTWDRKLLDVNEKMCQIVGRSKEELVGVNTRILYPTSEEYERVGKELEVLIDKKEPGVIESLWVNKEGNIRDVYMTFALIDVDNPSTGLTFTVLDVTERKLAEEQIYKLNQFQQTVIESADVWINVFNKDDEVVVWNNAAESISGYSKEEMLGNTSIWKLLYPDEVYLKEVVASKEAIFAEGKRISDLETSITRKDGAKRTISWNSRELFDEDQNIIGSIDIGIDITRQKEAENTIKQQVHFMQELIDAIPAPIFYKDTENIYLGCNNAFAEFTGISKEKMVGKGVYELYEKEIANRYHKMNKELIEKGGTQTYEYYLQSSSGQKRAVIFNNSIFTDIDGNTAGQIGVVFDITERKMAEDALKKHAHFIQELLETIPAPVYYKDKEGAYLGCNRAFENFSGTKREDLIGKVADDIYENYQAEEYNKMDRKVLINKGTQTYESEVVYAGDNTKRSVIFNKSVFTDTNNNVAGLIGVILDITERVRSEELLKEYSQRLEHSNELKGIFTDIMRHDLLNYVTVIDGYTDLLTASEEDEKRLEWLDKIDFSNKKLIELIESAAELAKLESTAELNFSSIDIGNMLSEIITHFEYQAEKRGLAIRLVSEGKFPALVNPMIEEVFANYISNALKYGCDNEDIKIDIEDADDKWKVKFTDSGEGIPDEYKPLVFERFKRIGNNDIKGSGLGLAIVKKIADLHNGEVGVEDNPEGCGSVFWVTVKKA